MSSSPEYHRSVSYESSWLSCLLANNPNSSFLHIYLPCSSSMQTDRKNQEHLQNRGVLFHCELLKVKKKKDKNVKVRLSLSNLRLMNDTHRQRYHCSRSTGRCSTLLFGHLSHSRLRLVDGWPPGLTFWITGSACFWFSRLVKEPFTCGKAEKKRKELIFLQQSFSHFVTCT